MRVAEEYPTGPEGIFLKLGKTVTLDFDTRLPFVHWSTGDDPRTDRVYYGKSYIYPLVAAPFVWLFGTNGFLVLHALLLVLNVAAAYAFLVARAPPAAAASYAVVFFLASAAPVYLVYLTPDFFKPVRGALRAFLVELQGGGACARGDGAGRRAVNAPAQIAKLRLSRGRAARRGHVLKATIPHAHLPSAGTDSSQAPVAPWIARGRHVRGGGGRPLSGERGPSQES